MDGEKKRREDTEKRSAELVNTLQKWMDREKKRQEKAEKTISELQHKNVQLEAQLRSAFILPDLDKQQSAIELQELEKKGYEMVKKIRQARERQVRREREEAETEKQCKICYTNDTSHALLPCGHFCVCEECLPHLRQCPICNGDFVDSNRIYQA
uniref:RING-type domain-containing protein n=2 Tax=Palpitomonas bilix TaxID=652834 RepID=A0A7S3D9I8_9EUKA|mmetsp:Transcript_27947/g.71106  ORF Transcript_27947/g.71106 Transcript_27947/m.71106 type:complete len:155 (+) Transcript_27947:452-916(+)